MGGAPKLGIAPVRCGSNGCAWNHCASRPDTPRTQIFIPMDSINPRIGNEAVAVYSINGPDGPAVPGAFAFGGNARYLVTLPTDDAQPPDPDFGDAPDTCGTTLAANGARHDPLGTLWLGAQIDSESHGQSGPLANGDDTDADGNDDDGARFVGPEVGRDGTCPPRQTLWVTDRGKVP